MRRRGVLLGLGLLALVVMLVCLARLKRQTAPAPPARAAAAPARTPPAVDLARHDGQTIDFSSGRPVVKTAPADQAALDRALQDMADATRDVTFAPTAGTTAAPPPAPKP